jgi:hypothetical protein
MGSERDEETGAESAEQHPEGFASAVSDAAREASEKLRDAALRGAQEASERAHDAGEKVREAAGKAVPHKRKNKTPLGRAQAGVLALRDNPRQGGAAAAALASALALLLTIVVRRRSRQAPK